MRQCGGGLRLQLDGFVEAFQRLVELVDRGLGHAAGFVGLGTVGLQLEGRVEILDGRFHVVRRQVVHAAEPQHLGILGREFDGRVEIGLPLLRILLQVAADHQCAALGGRIECRQPHGLVERGAGFFRLAQVSVQPAQQKLGLRLIGVELGGLHQIRQRHAQQRLAPARRDGTFEQLVAHQFGALREGAGQQLLGKAHVVVGQSLVDRLLAELDHLVEVRQAFRRKLDLHGFLEQWLSVVVGPRGSGCQQNDGG